MIGAEILDAVLRWSFDEFGVLLIIGTIWFGTLCLGNALRCGRSHCWIDGTLLPVLGAIGVLNLVGAVHFAWGSYLSGFWLILVGSVLVECVVGSYFQSSLTPRRNTQ